MPVIVWRAVHMHQAAAKEQKREKEGEVNTERKEERMSAQRVASVFMTASVVSRGGFFSTTCEGHGEPEHRGHAVSVDTF